MSPFVLVSVLIGPVLAIVIVLLVVRKLGGEQKEKQRILQTGMPAQARVLQLQHTGASVSFGAHRHLRLLLALEVHIQGRPPYQVQSEQLISELQIPSLQPGAWLQVRVDPANPQLLAIAGSGPAPQQPGYGQPPGGMPGQAPGAYGAPPMAPMGGMGMVPMDAAGAVNRGLKRAVIMTVVISVVVMIPLLAVFVDWSAFMGGGDAPKGGYCKALVRCCKEVSGGAGQCDNYANLPGSGCKTAYESYQKSAKAMGKSCE